MPLPVVLILHFLPVLPSWSELSPPPHAWHNAVGKVCRLQACQHGDPHLPFQRGRGCRGKEPWGQKNLVSFQRYHFLLLQIWLQVISKPQLTCLQSGAMKTYFSGLA